MKKLLCTLFCAAICSFAQAASAEDIQAGVIKTLTGNVHIERQGKTIPARVGLAILSSDRILTGENGLVGVTLSDDTLLSVGKKSTLAIEDFRFNSSTHDGQVSLKLLRGTLRSVTGLVAHRSPESFKVSTPNATIGVRGTDFIVEIPES